MVKFLIIITFLLLLVVATVTADKIRVGGHKIVYDEVITGDSDFDGVNDRTSYYLEDKLVFVAYDTTNDGEADLWFTYGEDTYKEVAMRDTTSDGKPEDVITYNKEGEIIKEEERTNLPWLWMILGFLVIAGGVAYYILRKQPKKKGK